MLTKRALDKIQEAIAHSPVKRGACIDALRIAQSERGWIDDETLEQVARLLEMTPDEVEGVATFYNLICRRSVGRHVIRICSSVSCWVMGYENLLAHLRERYGIAPGATTADGRFTLVTNQCLGACDRAPAFMVDDDLYVKLTPAKIDEILAKYE